MAREGDWATLLLPSGEMRQVRVECRATIGQVGNLDHQNVRIGKAGRKRHMGRRPHNRGTSMNPIAHPMGGGEGRSGGGVIRAARGASWPRAARPARREQELEQADPASAQERAVRAVGAQEEVSVSSDTALPAKTEQTDHGAEA